MDNLINNPNPGATLDRRGLLKCMTWIGTGLIWNISGGVPVSRLLGAADKQRSAGFSFVQISDSHIGFNKAANPDVKATLQAAVDKINALPERPDFLIHTGDLTQLSKPSQFDDMDQVLTGLNTKDLFHVPGEHDFIGDDGKAYLERYGKNAAGRGWYSFNHKGVHFLGLNNVAQLDGLGNLGPDQLEWLRSDLKGLPLSMPIVVFAHIPLWSVYPQWGWATKDGAEALSYLKRFGSVTVLNGHIHQTVQKIEGGITFHTAMSTAFPQPAPGAAPNAGPMTVPAGELRHVLGVTDVTFVAGKHSLAVIDRTLA